MLTLLLHPYMPETSGRLLDALAEDNRELAAFGSRGGGAAGRADPAAVPEARSELSATSTLVGLARPAADRVPPCAT